MPTEDASTYDEVKAAVLRRHDISTETYHQHFREARMKEGETHRELSTHLLDLASKWTKECTTVRGVVEMIVKEQLLDTMPASVRVWVHERNPQDSAEAGQLADDYAQARKVSGSGQSGSKRGERPAEQRSCFGCKQVGHVEQDCPIRRDGSLGGVPSGGPVQQGRKAPSLKCYNCGGIGHRARQCPGNALFRHGHGWQRRQGLTLHEIVEGQVVDDILLDTGCSKTLVQRELVLQEKIFPEQVPIRCAHGDTVMYPLANIEVQLGCVTFMVEAAVSDCLPVSILLGTDVPSLVELLNGVGRGSGVSSDSGEVMDALVMTRSQQATQERVEEEQRGKQLRCGVRPSPVDEVAVKAVDPLEENPDDGVAEGGVMIGAEFDDDLFSSRRVRQKMTRAQKRANKRNHRGERPCLQLGAFEINLMRAEVERLQAEDPTLVAVRVASEGGAQTAGPCFFRRDGLIYRRWEPPGCEGAELAVEKLVLPVQCRKAVLEMAHKIPMAGHMGKTKTAQRVLQRFYWPTLYKDIAHHCRSCSECQRAAPRSSIRAPLVPLPVMETPFERIAIDIVGPLPKSRVGNRFVLVICDYATRYPEAVPLRSCDTEHVAEALVNFFAQVGVPKEILSDQGTNFTSQLMKEIQNLLHIRAIKTTSYHPQTNGLVERFNKTLKSMLRKYATKSGKDWDKLLPYLLFAY